MKTCQEIEGKAKVYRAYLSFKTKGHNDIHDLTQRVNSVVRESGVSLGTVHLFCPGSTGLLTTMEYEGGLVEDLAVFLEKWAPQTYPYRHNLSHGDGNGHAHIRSSLLGPSLTLPIEQGEAALGTWQQVVFIDCDNRFRSRQITVTVSGI